LTGLIAAYKPFNLKHETNYYYRLVQAIIGQQLSVKAADTIEKRFVDLFGGKLPAPELILEKDIGELMAVGLSNTSSNYRTLQEE
jgi:DNA-3-methyladenine glycosylase II